MGGSQLFRSSQRRLIWPRHTPFRVSSRGPSVRFLDTLVHAPWYQRQLFPEAKLGAEDMRALHQVRELTGTKRTDSILIGKRPCCIYEQFLKKMNRGFAVRSLTEEAEIDQLSIRCVLSLALMAELL